MKFMIPIAMMLATMTSQAWAQSTYDCDVTAVRRLNVSNGVIIDFKEDRDYCRAGNANQYAVKPLKVVNNSEATISQLTTLATAALTNGLKVFFSWESAQAECNRNNYSCEISGYTAFQISI